MIYKVKVVEEVRYHITYEVEADSKDEAIDLVMGEVIEGDIEEQDITYYDILSVDEEHSDA